MPALKGAQNPPLPEGGGVPDEVPGVVVADRVARNHPNSIELGGKTEGVPVLEALYRVPVQKKVSLQVVKAIENEYTYWYN